MIKDWIRKGGRLLGWLTAITLALFVVAVMLLYTPPVQSFLSQQAENYLQQKLGSPVTIGGVGLQYPLALRLRALHLSTPAGDSLLSVGGLAVDVQLKPLFQKRVLIDQVALSQVKGRLIKTDSSSNFQFLLDAFTAESSTSSADTTTTNDGEWLVQFNEGTLSLDNIDWYYQDDLTGILLDLQLGTAEIETNTADLLQQRYSLRQLTLTNTQALLHLSTGATVEEDNPVDKRAIRASCEQLLVQKSNIEFLSDSVSVHAQIEELSLDQLQAVIAEKVEVNLGPSNLQAGRLQYDDLTAPESPGLDFNHLQFDSTSLRLQALSYQPDSLDLNLEQLAFREKSGFELTGLRTRVRYQPDSLMIKELDFRTPVSELRANQVVYAFPTDSTMLFHTLNLKTEGQLNVADLLLLAPQLRQYAWVNRHPNAEVKLGITLRGENNTLQATRLDCRGPGLQLVSSGRFEYNNQPEKIAGALNLQYLSFLPEELLPFLPTGAVPDYINWPRQIITAGQLSYRNEQIQLDFQAQEERPEQRTWSQVSLSGAAVQVLDSDRTALDLRLDSLRLTRASVLAYLPPAGLPPGYQLPTYLQASGSASGPLDNLTLRLRLALPGNETYAQLNGQVQEVLQPEQLRFDLQLEDIAVRRDEIQPLLPDSLLPTALLLPDLRIQDGRVSGSPDSLQLRVPISSSKGTVLLSGQYQTKAIDLDLQVEQLQVANWFQEPWRDSIAQLGLQPLFLNAQISGQLEPGLDLRLAAELREEERGQLLQALAFAQDSSYSLDVDFLHPALQGQGAATYAFRDSLEEVSGALDLQTVDLVFWGLSERPLSAEGRVELASKGLSTDQLEARLLIDDLLLRGGGAAAFADSLLVTVNLLDGNNRIELSGDVLEGYLRGQFAVEEIVGELERYFAAQLGGASATENQLDKDQYFEMALRIKNPLPLTTGIIPQLNALSAMEMKLAYEGKRPALGMTFNLPELTYAGLSLHGMQLEAKGNEEGVQARADWQDVAYGEDIALGQTTITTQSAVEGLDIALQVFATDSLRHQLALNWQRETSSAQVIRLQPKQRINFRPWTIPANNQIRWQDSTLNITDWSFAQNGSAIALSSPNQKDLRAEFRQVDLSDLSRIVNNQEELVGGVLNGELLLEQVLAKPLLALDIAIQQLQYYDEKLGNLEAQVRQQPTEDFAIDLQLAGADNSVSANGLYLANNELDILLQLNRLQLSSLEPFTLGYLREPAGFLTGTCSVKGSTDAPRLAGGLTFHEAELTISLLGSRFFLDSQVVAFEQELIQLKDFTILDPRGNRATMDGQIQINSLDDIRLDLQARTRDFQAVASTAADNDLFYGNLSVNADADIHGSVANPRVVINASPSSDSQLTYAYSLSQQAGLETTQDILTFAETYEWEERLIAGQSDSSAITTDYLGAYVETNLTINEKLLVKVLVDPLTKQTFQGRGTGAITFIQRPSGQQEMTGEISLANGVYDMVLEGLQRYEFLLEPGSTIFFTGNPTNPQLDLSILNTVATSPFPLVKTFDPTGNSNGLRGRETFEVVLGLTGDLQSMDINADIRYPEDKYGNEGFTAVEDALSQLKQDQTRTYTTAITLVTLNSFVLPTLEASGNPQQDIVNGLAGAVGNALSSLVNERLGGVKFDVGIENYETASGDQNYNVRLSLQKSFFNDRLIVSVDGVTNTAEEVESADNTSAATYLDNVSVAYLLDEEGTLRIKVFNDRDENVFVGGNVMRVGGRLVFSKDFDHFFWQKR